MTMWTKAFWLDVLDRAIRTVVQALLAGLTVGLAITDQPWLTALGTAATAGVLSVLTSIVTASATNGDPALSPPVPPRRAQAD